MKVKAKIVFDVDHHTIQSVEFADKTLNSSVISEHLMEAILNKVSRSPIEKFSFVPNSSLNPIGNPYMLLEANLEVFPQIYEHSDKSKSFLYGCTLHDAPKKSVMPYERYCDKRRKYVLDLAMKSGEMTADKK